MTLSLPVCLRLHFDRPHLPFPRKREINNLMPPPHGLSHSITAGIKLRLLIKC